jgi:hypothetical protein
MEPDGSWRFWQRTREFNDAGISAGTLLELLAISIETTTCKFALLLHSILCTISMVSRATLTTMPDDSRW